MHATLVVVFHDGMSKARRSWAAYTRSHWRGWNEGTQLEHEYLNFVTR
jgi:hypothetical protein